jgi:hypothetical protein
MAPANRIDHPHVAIDGVGGPPGHLPAHFHSSSLADGLTFECPAPTGPNGAVCATIYEISWAELDALNEGRLVDDPDAVVLLPPCPSCGATTQFCVNDIEYGSELPEHHTMKMLREHVVPRAAFGPLEPHPASRLQPSHQGFDFSHLPGKDRPPHHRKVDVAAEARQRHAPSERPDARPPKQHPALVGAVVPGELRSAE